MEVGARRFGNWALTLLPWSGLGLIVDGLAWVGSADSGTPATPDDYVSEVLLAPEHRDAFFSLIDTVGLVVCRNLGGDDAMHRDVRGRSSRGRLSPGEYFHHDGCSGPTKPRVVEIRCPRQAVPRHTATAIAPFPALLGAMLEALPRSLSVGEEISTWRERFATDGELPSEQHDHVQGLLNRALRRGLSAEDARAYFRDVDLAAGAFREPWTMGESRFIANENTTATMQHRRAYLQPHLGGLANGHLVKRWPAEQLAGLVICDSDGD